jgi:geranylgeranyl reductase family protein
MIWDVIIIGAGPIGSFIGYLLGNKGFKVVILEEHSKIGEPIHCLGKLSLHAFKEFPLPKNSILCELKGSYLFSPKGKEIKLKKDNPDSYILDRTKFDRDLSEMAEKNGAKILLNSKAYGVEHLNGFSNIYVKDKNKEKIIKGKVIIDAEGAKRQFLRNLGYSMKPYLVGLQCEISGISLRDRECVELYFGKNFSKGFFSWISPLKENVVKIGTAVLPQNNPKIYLENLIMKIRERYENFKIEREYSGIIPIFGPYEEYIFPNILIIGDSAGYNKSTTGGGIYFGLKGARLAVEQIEKYFETGNIKFLKEYPKLTRKSFGKELLFTAFMRRFLNKLNDDELDELWNIILSNPQAIKNLEEKGDTAYQTTLLSIFPNYLISNPQNLKILKFLPQFFKSFLESM